jgi:hypothetical protein
MERQRQGKRKEAKALQCLPLQCLLLHEHSIGLRFLAAQTIGEVLTRERTRARVLGPR